MLNAFSFQLHLFTITTIISIIIFLTDIMIYTVIIAMPISIYYKREKNRWRSINK